MMSISELQSITDSLAHRIQRPVTIDDTEMRLLTHSEQAGDIDDPRLASILRRRVPENVVSWLRDLRIAEATGPMRVPANPELGTIARVLVPIRCHGTLLGYLWAIDANSSLTDDDLAIVNAAAEAAGNVLYRELLLVQLERVRERELLRDLLSEQSDVRQYAADELVKEGIFRGEGPISVLVARPVVPNGKAWDEDVQLAANQALEDVRKGRLFRKSLHLVRPDHAILVVGLANTKQGADEVLELGSWLHATLAERLDGMGLNRLVIGVGEAQPSLVYVARSHRQAQQAARVGEIVVSLGPVVAWSQLGIYQTLSHFPFERLLADALHPGLIRLLENANLDWLTETLERYLDRAGDAKATATDLALHRASLYYRLQKIEQIANVDLRRGEDRLALHLGLKLARLAGIYPHHRRR